MLNLSPWIWCFIILFIILLIIWNTSILGYGGRVFYKKTSNKDPNKYWYISEEKYNIEKNRQEIQKEKQIGTPYNEMLANKELLSVCKTPEQYLLLKQRGETYIKQNNIKFKTMNDFRDLYIKLLNKG